MSILPSCAEIFGLAFPRCCRGRLTGCAHQHPLEIAVDCQ